MIIYRFHTTLLSPGSSSFVSLYMLVVAVPTHVLYIKQQIPFPFGVRGSCMAWFSVYIFEPYIMVYLIRDYFVYRNVRRPSLYAQWTVMVHRDRCIQSMKFIPSTNEDIRPIVHKSRETLKIKQFKDFIPVAAFAIMFRLC